MKKSLIASLLAIAFASGAAAHDASVTTTINAAAISSSSASAFAGTGGGLSISTASDVRNAGVTGAGSGTAGTVLFTKFTSVGATGGVTTGGLSSAANVSLGNANGSAVAGGTSQASAVATGAGHTVAGGPLVSLTANAEGINQTNASVGSNGLAIVGGAGTSSYNVQASATQTKIGSLVNQIDVGTSTSLNAITTPSLNVSIGNATTFINNQQAANGHATASVGSVSAP